MKAIILAGGKGTRLRPLTCELPKPMVPVANIPLMEHIILLLRKHGIVDIGVTLMYMPQKIKAYFGDGAKWGVQLTWFIEESPLGTAGSILHAASFLNEPFIVISGDCITDMNLSEAISFHQSKKNLATIILVKSSNPESYGIVHTDSCSVVTGFLEKPSKSEVFSDNINTGIYVMEPDILHHIQPGCAYDFSHDLFPALLESGIPFSGYIMKHYWSDVGSLESYLETHRNLLDRKVDLPFLNKNRSGNIFIGQSTIIEPTATINSPCIIGNNCYIGRGTVIDSYTVIGNNCIIEERTSIKSSILHHNITVGHGSELRGSILGNRVRLMQYVSSFENVVIGEGSMIQERCVIKPNIRIWPGKTVAPLSIIDRNIINSTWVHPSFFHHGRISGTINVDFTPEFVSRLGSAFGSVLGSGKGAVVSSDATRPSEMLKHAIISGLMSSGVQVYHLQHLPTPLSRLAVQKVQATGGLHIRRSSELPEKLEIDFFDETGANIDSTLEKNVESTFFKEDFSRCRAGKILNRIDVYDFTKTYIHYLKDRIHIDCTRGNLPNLFIMSNCESMLLFIRNVFEKLHIPIAGEMLIDRFDPVRHRNVEHCLHADITAYIDGSGENLALLDSRGKMIDENTAFLLYAYILFKSVPGIKVVAPLNMTSSLEQMAHQYGGAVKWTKVSRHAILRELLKTDVFSGTINQYLLFFDAVAALAKMVEFLCINKTSLDNLMNAMPPYHLEHTSFQCPFDAIGRVMRILLSENSYHKQILEGIKIKVDNSWVLIIPDSQSPFIHLYTEGDSSVEAERLLREYSARISGLLPDRFIAR